MTGDEAVTRARAVFLDFDGTMARMHPSHYGLYARAATECGVPLTELAFAQQTVGDAWARWMTPLGPVHDAESSSEAAFREVRIAIACDRIALARPGIDPATLRRIGERAAELERDASYFHLYEDTRPALERYRAAGLDAVIVSNHVWHLPEIVEALGIGPLVRAVISSARVGARKPHPRIFEAALAATRATPHEVVMVGDSMSADVDGARRAGLHAVLIDRGRHHAADDAPGELHVIRSLLEVPLQWTAADRRTP